MSKSSTRTTLTLLLAGMVTALLAYAAACGKSETAATSTTSMPTQVSTDAI